MTEPIFNPESLRLNLLEDIFEKHKFRSLLLQTRTEDSSASTIHSHSLFQHPSYPSMIIAPITRSLQQPIFPTPLLGPLWLIQVILLHMLCHSLTKQNSRMPSRGTYCSFTIILVQCLNVRIDVGGKLLTNYLKELVSYRHWNMMHEVSVPQKIHLVTSSSETLLTTRPI